MLPRVMLCASVIMLSGCVKRGQPLAKVPQQPIDPNAYVDLIPGCRLRVVTPLFALGKYQPPSNHVAVPSSEPKSSITVAAPRGFIGYETAYYLLTPRSDGRGAAITFRYATTTKGGVTRITQSSKQLFRVAPNIRFFRLVFLVRVSRNDHNMALLGTKRRDALNDWTAAILARPESCVNLRDRICSWIPEGTAVRPEIAKVDGNSPRWVPLR